MVASDHRSSWPCSRSSSSTSWRSRYGVDTRPDFEDPGPRPAASPPNTLRPLLVSPWRAGRGLTDSRARITFAERLPATLLLRSILGDSRHVPDRGRPRAPGSIVTWPRQEQRAALVDALEPGLRVRDRLDRREPGVRRPVDRRLDLDAQPAVALCDPRQRPVLPAPSWRDRSPSTSHQASGLPPPPSSVIAHSMPRRTARRPCRRGSRPSRAARASGRAGRRRPPAASARAPGSAGRRSSPHHPATRRADSGSSCSIRNAPLNEVAEVAAPARAPRGRASRRAGARGSVRSGARSRRRRAAPPARLP